MVRVSFTIGCHNGFVDSGAIQIDQMPEGRFQPRTHLFVTATLYADSGAMLVHIRNMSPTGALIEAAILPEVERRIMLKRGRLHAAGWIAWRSGRRAGVRLEAAVHVPDWMTRQVSAGQERVDTLVSIARAEGTNYASTDAMEPHPAPVEAELLRLRAELAELEDALVGDNLVAASHPEIQTLDVSLQRIDRILKAVRAGG